MDGRNSGASSGPNPGCDTTFPHRLLLALRNLRKNVEAHERFHRPAEMPDIICRIASRDSAQCRIAGWASPGRCAWEQDPRAAPMPSPARYRARRPRHTSLQCVPCRGLWPLAASGAQKAACKPCVGGTQMSLPRGELKKLWQYAARRYVRGRIRRRLMAERTNQGG